MHIAHMTVNGISGTGSLLSLVQTGASMVSADALYMSQDAWLNPTEATAHTSMLMRGQMLPEDADDVEFCTIRRSGNARRSCMEHQLTHRTKTSPAQYPSRAVRLTVDAQPARLNGPVKCQRLIAVRKSQAGWRSVEGDEIICPAHDHAWCQCGETLSGGSIIISATYPCLKA